MTAGFAGGERNTRADWKPVPKEQALEEFIGNMNIDKNIDKKTV